MSHCYSVPTAVETHHMKEIQLVGGRTAQIDDADLELVSQYLWSFEGRGRKTYAVCYLSPCQRLWMHRLLTGAGAREVVDHIDGDGLNNQRSNLRVCSNAENQRNRGKPKTRARIASRFKGVSWHNGKWRAKIVLGGKQRHLGYFAEERDAARAYDKAAEEHHGEFAWTNGDNGLPDDPVSP